MANAQTASSSDSAKARHLVALIDGTWVSPTHKRRNEQQSNVFWLDLFLESANSAGEAQIAFYHPGIGAATSIGEKWLGGGIALGLERLVEAAYLDIVANFRKEDKIYIVGFSRGAVVARVVASLVARFGVLNPYFVEYYLDMWKHARGERPDTDAETIRNNHCIQADVEFLGLFDTVPGAWVQGSSLESGVIRESFFANKTLPRNIKRALHILSMDERRVEFQPIEFEGVEDDKAQRLEQIWMPGIHSDIGGGYTEDLLSNVSLITMIDRLRAAGLSLDNGRLGDLKQNIRRQFKSEKRIIVHDEPSRWNWGFPWPFSTLQRRPKNMRDYYHEFCERIEKRLIQTESGPRTFVLENYNWPPLPVAHVDLLAESLDSPPDRTDYEGIVVGM
ncbi:DUF2235 domain-containing protein [Methylosinus sporium]|uniref:DUF2235 domain-containing protein n=1 Tax=Methylosinus sporium TaxID=428 RepID=A0A549T4B0_METSR|nr:DUF2235 domain-containing protein [Methylosinus sporium]TRL36723.1 DUF2235 domain-containing protein [Methylosinus sporium]